MRWPSRSVPAVVLISCAVLLTYLVALTIERPQAGEPLHKWLSDDYDRGVYFDRAQFYPKGLTLYKEVFSEYPTVGTLSFVVPFLLPGGSTLTRDAYMFRWSCLMAVVSVVTIALIAICRQRHGVSATPALLLLGPSALYFSVMRFDILCACLVCVSLMAFARERYLLAHVVLGVATLVKWYPGVMFPVYLAFHLSQDSPRARTDALRYATAYTATVLAIIGVTIAYATWDGFLVPYRFHGERGAQYFNPYWVLAWYRPRLGLGDAAWAWVNRGFIALQLLILPVLLVVRVRSLTDVFRHSVLAIYLFVTFARVDSPQWILWYLPVILMFARRPSTLALVGLLTVCNYGVFPIAFDYAFYATRNFGVPWFPAIVLVKDIVLVALIVAIHGESGVGTRLETTNSTVPSGLRA